MADNLERFCDRSQIQKLFLDPVNDAYEALSRETGNPNQSPKITTEAYLVSVDELAEPFFAAVNA